MFGFWRKLWPSSKDNNIISLSQGSVGTYVVLSVKDPRKMGVRDPSNILMRRFDPEDIANIGSLGCIVLPGTITGFRETNGLRLIEFSSTKVVNGERRERLYTIMEDEIKEIKRIV